MKATVTDQGLTIPKEMLEGVSEIKILNKGTVLTLHYVEDDHVFKLGTDAINGNITDASVNLDEQVY